MKKIYLLSLATVAAMPTALMAEIPEGYYDNLKGLSGGDLKTAIYTTIKSPNTPGYGPGANKTWWAFYETDQLPDGTYLNRYSDLKFEVGERGSRPKKDIKGTTNSKGDYIEMNIEHSFPKSWWGGTEGSIYNDLFNLYPSDNSTNSAKSNLVMDRVASVSTDDGYTKIGRGTNVSENVWEPIDTYKGDFSRGYMYMISAWQNYKWVKVGLQFLDNNLYPTFKQWAADLYSEWCRLDEPDQIEIDRNEAVYRIQGNRNPYIDFPNLFEYLWGDSTDCAFDPEKTVVAGGGIYRPASPLDPANPDHYYRMEILYAADYTNADNGVTETTVKAPGSSSKVWNRSTQYGWVANSFIGGTRYESDATLYTEEIDLAATTNAYMQFEHAVNFLPGKCADYLTVSVVCDGVDTPINDLVTWPAGNSWSFIKSGIIDLSVYAGKKVRIGFRYTSTTSTCGAWEIKSIELRGGSTSGIDNIFNTPVKFDPSLPAEYYTIDGRRVHPSTSGLLIVRQGGRTYKILR